MLNRVSYLANMHIYACGSLVLYFSVAYDVIFKQSTGMYNRLFNMFYSVKITAIKYPVTKKILHVW